MAIEAASPKSSVSDLSALYDHLTIISEPSQSPQADLPPVRPKGTLQEKLRQSNLMPREITEVVKALLRGAKLRLMMQADDETAGQMLTPPCISAESQFQDVQDLKTSGYFEKPNPDTSEELTWKRIGLVLDCIGLGSVLSSEFRHSVPIHHECYLAECCSLDHTYHRPAFAHFMQVINSENGTIVAYDNLSPIGADREAGRNGGPLPDLKFWSDVAYLQWKSRASPTANLKYVLRFHVLNDATYLAVEAINEVNCTKKMSWPGITYSAASDEGRTLLGTPNGSSVAYLLIQHKAALGHKTVDKITVFREGRDLMLLFHITDV